MPMRTACAINAGRGITGRDAARDGPCICRTPKTGPPWGRCMSRPVSRVGRPSAIDAALIESRILSAAWDVLMARGLEHFTIDQVAVLAQASKRTIYARFPNRTRLYRRMIADRTAAFIDSIRDQPRGDDLAATLAGQAIRIVHFIRSPEGRALIHLEEATPGDDGETPVRRSIHQRAIAAATQTLREANVFGMLAADGIDEAATFWVASLIGYGRMIHNDPALIPDDRGWAHRHTALFLRAVQAQDGNGGAGGVAFPLR